MGRCYTLGTRQSSLQSVAVQVCVSPQRLLTVGCGHLHVCVGLQSSNMRDCEASHVSSEDLWILDLRIYSDTYLLRHGWLTAHRQLCKRMFKTCVKDSRYVSQLTTFTQRVLGTREVNMMLQGLKLDKQTKSGPQVPFRNQSAEGAVIPKLLLQFPVVAWLPFCLSRGRGFLFDTIYHRPIM